MTFQQLILKSLSENLGEIEDPEAPYREKPYRQINRFGLHNLCGTSVRNEPDLTTLQVLEEIKFLPRRFPCFENMDNAIKSQASLPGIHGTIEKERSSENLGLGSLKFSPMKLNRVYGRNESLPVINLTGLHKSHIVYVGSNAVIFFDYYQNCQSVLQGHKNKIVCIALDKDSKYIATGDVGQDSALIIWNVNTGFPVKNLPVTGGKIKSGITSVGFIATELSYIGTIQLEQVEVEVIQVNENDKTEVSRMEMKDQQHICIWYFGDPNQRKNKLNRNINHPEARLVIPPKSGVQRDILFSRDAPHHFVTTGDKRIIFYTWIHHERRITYYFPKGHKKLLNRLKIFTQSIWWNDTVLTTTSGGYIVEWKVQPPLGLEEPSNPHLNIKEFRRSVKVDEYAGLTAIVVYKEFIVVGDDLGSVRFLDSQFRILRWTKTHMDSHVINSISFNLVTEQPDWKFEMRQTYGQSKYEYPSAHRTGYSAVYDHTFGGTKYRPPSETTLEKPPMHAPDECLDMVVGYTGGEIAYFHIAEEKVDVIVQKNLGTIVALDVSPTTSHFAISTEFGEIQMYDYKSKEIIFSSKIFKKKVKVTFLKFHPSGSLVVLGTDTGTVFFRKAFSWGLSDNPLHCGKDSIIRITFSSCGLYMAVFDTDYVVTLCNYNPRKGVWVIKGKHRSHYRPIVDVNFFFDTRLGHQRLFSLGQDRRLVEYDILQSTPSNGLKILSVMLIEQLCIPTSFLFDAPFPNHGPIVLFANTNNKIRMFDQDAGKIRKTCQGPEYGAPVNRMILIAPEARTGRDTNFILMILGNKIGLMKTPVDGNPFKYMAILGHYSDIKEVGIGFGGREVFTCAEEDSCIFMWRPDILVLENCTLTGGSGITPFKHYLDSGLEPGCSVVQDIENMFYHLMMKRAENQTQLLTMSLKIPLADIPTVMRLCGYFPSELEIDMLFEEVEFLLGIKYGEKQEEIGYEDFLMLYANHKDGGVEQGDVVRAFEILGEFNEQDLLCIPRDNFVSLITTKGEALKEMDLPLFLPNFYKSIHKMDVVKKKESWFLKTSNASSVNALSAIEQIKSDTSSLDFKKSQKSSFGSSRSVEFHSKLKVPSTERHSVVFSMSSGETQYPEDETDQQSEIPREMPNDITVDFFINHLLPLDVQDTLNLERNELADDLNDLLKISEDHPAEKPFNEILNRWKGRDEWRYFKRIFDILKHEAVPFDKKLETVMELDYFCQHGKWPETDWTEIPEIEEIGEFYSEEEGETENGLQISLVMEEVETLQMDEESKRKSIGRGILKSEKFQSFGSEPEEVLMLDHVEKISIKNLETDQDQDDEENDDFDLSDFILDDDTGDMVLEIEPITLDSEFDDEILPEDDPKLGVRNPKSLVKTVELFDTDSDVTQGDRDTPPFSNLPNDDDDTDNI